MAVYSQLAADPNGSGGTYYYSESEDGFSGGAFDYLYKYSNYQDVLKDLKSPNALMFSKSVKEEPQVYSTKISKYNPYYYKVGYSTPDGKPGKSTAIIINNYDRLYDMWIGMGGRSFSTYYNQIGSKLDSWNGTVLPNCVGFVNARSNEVWDLALKSGTIKQEGSKFINTATGKEINKFVGVPACNAYGFSFSYFYDGRYPGYYKSDTPVPGAIASWKRSRSSNGMPGHVGFVEGVYNQGKEDEYILTSESGYYAGGVSYVVWITRLYKRDGYASSTGPLAGFMCSPVCELAQFGRPDQTVTVDDVLEPTSEDIAAMEDASRGLPVIKELHIGDAVEIQWFGNEKQDGSGKRINKLGCKAYIAKEDLTQKYPYSLTIDKKVIFGYYQRDALKFIEPEIV